MIVLGLNAFHADAAAALVIDGQLKAAAEEERFRRIKHWAGFPSEAISWCLASQGLKLEQVDAIAVNTDPASARHRRLWYGLSRRPSLKLVLEKLKTRRRRLGVTEHLARAFPEARFHGTVVPVEHHLAHLGSAYFPSPFERALALSIDGFGDFASGAWGLGNGDRLGIDAHVWFPHSLGIFYQALTQFLGFPNYGDEYKVMGLAPYGTPRLLEPLRRLLLSDDPQQPGYRLDLRWFRHHRDSVAAQWEDGSPAFGALFAPALAELLGPARNSGEALTDHHRDLAASVQGLYEEVLFRMLGQLHARYREDRLVLAGGCAQNSVANGKLTRATPFREVYIAASGADAGGAIGAALVAARARGAPRTAPMRHGYWGTTYSDAECATAIVAERATIHTEGITVQHLEDPQSLCERVVARILQGHVVGWFQGRMEWGPRALGNRSILADPRRSDIKDILNLKIKRRESFRPFAPSILREAVPQWFEVDDDVPFMSQVFPILPAQRQRIPAVCHVDGSGRLQTVRQEDNPLYHRLISTFADATGVPILLNTSFNENEPVVCRPQEALACFLRTKMDVLALGGWLLERP